MMFPSEIYKTRKFMDTVTHIIRADRYVGHIRVSIKEIPLLKVNNDRKKAIFPGEK